MNIIWSQLNLDNLLCNFFIFDWFCFRFCKVNFEKFLKINLAKPNQKASKNEKITKKIIKIKLGPNNVHTILDSLEIEH